jgi:3-oxoacyl-[acyl-carrier protein] reductase
VIETRPQRTALVTGAARGIGLAVVRRLLAGGHRVAMTDLDAVELEAAAATLPHERVLTLALDVSQEDAPERLQKAILARWDPVAILVNNAGVTPKRNGRSAGLTDLALDEWEFVLRVNLTAQMRMAQRFVPHMGEAGWGRVVNLSSRAGRSASTSSGPAYMSAKAGVLGLTRAIASEFGRFGVTANAVAPGLVDTLMTQAISEDLRARIRSTTPVGRSGTPDEIAAIVAFLASPDAGFITGACIDANGGAFMC